VTLSEELNFADTTYRCRCLQHAMCIGH